MFDAFSSSPKYSNAELPIGIFDSGVGGLTVFAAIHKALPKEHLLYLGDTARLPYGTKSTETVVRYAVQAAEKLVSRGVKMLVIACNTATAAALPALQKAFPHIPVVGVVEPGAQAVCRATRNGSILVLATESTIKNEAYQKAIKAIHPEFSVTGVACPLFVALAEEGWLDMREHDPFVTEGNIVKAVAARYLAPVFARFEERKKPDSIVLGCTHFPPLAPAIRAVVGDGIALVDSAATTANVVEQQLSLFGLRRAGSTDGVCRFLTTDAPERFCRVGSLFLGAPIADDALDLVVL